MDAFTALPSGKPNSTDKRGVMILRFGLVMMSILFLACHLFFLVYYHITGAPILANINIVSVACYMIILFLNRKRLSFASALIMLFELPLYCMLTVLLVGWGVGAQWYLTVMSIPFYLLYQIPSVMRKLCVAGFSAALAACYLIKHFTVPVYAGGDFEVMTALNVAMAIIGPIIIIFVLNISNSLTERTYRRTIDTLTQEANRDALTGLWNRRYVEQYLEKLYQDPHQRDRAFLAMVDIDLFKNINDTYGHGVGDEVLVWLSREAQQSFRQSDIIARWGGEEFLVIITDTDERGARTAYSSFLRKIKGSTLAIRGHELRITVTIGYDTCAGGGTYADCIKRSDEALYYGKNNGRSQVVYRRVMGREI